MVSYHTSSRLIALPTSSSWMGEDLCVEIFKRLPVKTLLRFRCVCKLWKTLISSSLFNNLHHSFTSSTSTTPSKLKPYIILNFNHTFYGLYRPEEALVELLRHDLHFPFRFRNNVNSKNHLTCVDVIHGLVCVSYSLDSSFDSTILWNPAIHKYVALPHLPLASQSQKLMADYSHVVNFNIWALFYSNVIGFGYDTSKNDFKVVRIWIPCNSAKQYCKSHPPTFEVYSTREGLWRVATADFKINSCEFFHICTRRISCFVNGAIHWLLISDNSIYHVLMFDCESEEFRTTVLPKEIYQGKDAYILEYAGKLSVMLRKFTPNGDVGYFEMWVMEEHGVASSWKKLYTIPNPNRCYNLKVCDIDVYKPLFGKLTPYGPNPWTKNPVVHIDKVMRYHVYEESMYLMNDTKAQSYAQEEIVHI